MADDGSNFLSGLSFFGDTQSVGPSGGFRMSTSEMETLLSKAEGTRKLIQEQIVKAQALVMCEPPGKDVSSVGFANTANNSGRYYIGHLQIQFNRYGALIDKLNTALGRTTATDQANADAAKDAGKEGKY
ncbi:hypothetical protein [Amycolatopsis sp. NPDC059021]|uniref:hypothetical protein n=1 Tax=Amycolatopsis sp. NPDC059021 TaxID=3346704 RepID=UPI0036723EF1